jgi:hypothetical protein
MPPWFSRRSRDLRFAFESRAPEGTMDQILTLTNPGRTAVVLHADLTPLDASGRPVTGVRTISHYGSTEGRMVLVPGENVDVLGFLGDDAAQVTDVRVEVRESQEVDFPAVGSLVVSEPLRADGTPASYVEPFTHVRLHNANPVDVPARVAVILWAPTTPDAPQQPVLVTDLVEEATLVPGGGETVVEMGARCREALVRHDGQGVAISAKAYLSR